MVVAAFCSVLCCQLWLKQHRTKKKLVVHLMYVHVEFGTQPNLGQHFLDCLCRVAGAAENFLTIGPEYFLSLFFFFF